MNDSKNGRTNYLVFEREEDPSLDVVQARDAMGHPVGPAVPRRGRPALLRYVCIGAVKAKDEEAAVQAVIRATRRIGAYAVIPATFLDFTQPVDEVDEVGTLELNP